MLYYACWVSTNDPEEYIHVPCRLHGREQEGLFRDRSLTRYDDTIAYLVFAFLPDQISPGFVGGGEQFDYFIGEYCEQYIREHLRQEPDAGVKQSLINMFHTKKQDLGPDFEYDYEDHELYLTWGSSIRVTLSPEVLEDAFNKALGGPLAHADNLLFKASQVMAGRGNRGPWAIVTGGTSRSKVLQARLTSMCESKGFRKPLFVEDDSVSIANRFP